jgi:hypothetical protein
MRDQRRRRRIAPTRPRRPVPISSSDPGSGVGESASAVPSEGGPPGSPLGSVELAVVEAVVAAGAETPPPGTSEMLLGTGEMTGGVDATVEAGGPEGALGRVGSADGGAAGTGAGLVVDEAGAAALTAGSAEDG